MRATHRKTNDPTGHHLRSHPNQNVDGKSWYALVPTVQHWSRAGNCFPDGAVFCRFAGAPRIQQEVFQFTQDGVVQCFLRVVIMQSQKVLDVGGFQYAILAWNALGTQGCQFAWQQFIGFARQCLALE